VCLIAYEAERHTLGLEEDWSALIADARADKPNLKFAAGSLMILTITGTLQRFAK
jgi:hypothetical protein